MKTDNPLIVFFSQHKVAANLVMLMMIFGGIFALKQLNVRFFPDFELDLIRISVKWPSSSSEDVESQITQPLEQAINTLDGLRKYSSTSSEGQATITLELVEGTNAIVALNQAQQKTDEFRNLPEDTEDPVVTNLVRYEKVAKLLIYGVSDLFELRTLARQFEHQLLQKGIDKVDITGLPEEEIVIQISEKTLHELSMTLDEIGNQIALSSLDVPAGTFAEAESTTEIRALNQRRQALEFSQLPVITTANTQILLSDIAQIKRQNKKSQPLLFFEGKPAVQLEIKRAENGDSFKSAKRFQEWLEQTEDQLPTNVQLHVYDESWSVIYDRIYLLIKNGGSGLLLVVAILYIFLSPRIAFWVALGIPVSFMATLLILYYAGGSINMISLFALIMALGIIVDDAIVVGEDGLTHFQQGVDSDLAAIKGAGRMFAPVIASSLTTIAAFIPLMMVSGHIGKILFDIPLVILSVILASLLESFLVLPNHMKHSFKKMDRKPKPGWHTDFNQRFEEWKDSQFRHLITLTLQNRATALSLTLAVAITSVGLLSSDRIKFQFFPSPESSLIFMDIGFVPGTPRAEVSAFLKRAETALIETDQHLSNDTLVLTQISHLGSGISTNKQSGQVADHLASMTIELTSSDRREVRNETFIQEWKRRLPLTPGLINFTISSRNSGPPGQDVAVLFTGSNGQVLKKAALELASVLSKTPGLSNIKDDLPYGRNQMIFELNETGLSLGLTVTDVSQQIRHALDGKLVQLFQEGKDEVEVRVMLNDQEKNSLYTLHQLDILLPTGKTVPLSSIVNWTARHGFEVLRHSEGQLAVEISASVDSNLNNADNVIKALKAGALEQIKNKYDIDYSFEGRSADQAETLGDMLTGLMIGLSLIYLILAWVFSSYGWPLVVMMAIPFGLIGAILGHYFMGLDLTILSLFGFFGLSGIVINDSIILVTFYQQLIDKGIAHQEALIQASCQRLRAVILTSLTTIAGLIPLLFETSLQAQFLIPMATSIAFGLIFSTVLVLLIIPVLLSYQIELKQWILLKFNKKLCLE